MTNLLQIDIKWLFNLKLFPLELTIENLAEKIYLTEHRISVKHGMPNGRERKSLPDHHETGDNKQKKPLEYAIKTNDNSILGNDERRTNLELFSRSYRSQGLSCQHISSKLCRQTNVSQSKP